MRTSDFTRSIWLWLFSEGGYWTAAKIAEQTGHETMEVFNCVSRMERGNLVKKIKTENSRYLAYGIDGTCQVPCGLALAEVQEI